MKTKRSDRGDLLSVSFRYAHFTHKKWYAYWHLHSLLHYLCGQDRVKNNALTCLICYFKFVNFYIAPAILFQLKSVISKQTETNRIPFECYLLNSPLLVPNKHSLLWQKCTPFTMLYQILVRGNTPTAELFLAIICFEPGKTSRFCTLLLYRGLNSHHCVGTDILRLCDLT